MARQRDSAGGDWSAVPPNGGEGMEGNGDGDMAGSDGTQYMLYAVIHHIGALSAGHYVASIKSEQDGKWYCFNDSRVSALSSHKHVI